MTGHLREARGHRYVGGMLGKDDHQRRHAGAIAAVIAALISAYAAYSASQAQAKLAEYQQDVAEEQAKASREAAATAEENQRDEAQRILAAQRARIAGSGVLGDVGSPLLLQMESAGAAELDARRIRYAGETQAQGFEQEGILRGYEGKLAKRQGYINAGAALLSGASSAYGASSKGSRTSSAGTTYGGGDTR